MATATHLPANEVALPHGIDYVSKSLPVPTTVSPSVNDEQVSIQINKLTINGFLNANTGVANFLNVPYARIPARFWEARLIDPRQEVGTIEAVKYGPCCPQPFDVIHDLTGHLYPKVIDVSNAAEFSCLSVNIYAPPNAITSSMQLPVFVWIHGGAFTYGDASDEYSRCC